MASSSSAEASTPLSEGQTFDLPPPDFKNEASLAPHVITPDARSHSIQKFPHEWYNFSIQAANQITSLLSSLDIRTSQCESLESERDQIRRQLRDSNDELIAARALIITLRGHPFPIGHADSRSERLSDIPKFLGKKEDLRSWTTQLHLKLFVNKDRFTGEKSGLIYAISRLEGRALSQVQPYVNSQHEISLPDVPSLLLLLEHAFGDPDRKATAQRELRALRQANREFHVYLADFQRIAPDTNFDEEAQRAALQQGISEELQQLMVTQQVPEDLNELISLLQRLDTRQRNVNALLRKSYSPRSAPSSSDAGTTLRNHPSGGVALPRTVSPAAAAPASPPDAMDLSAFSRGKLPSAEVTRRMNEGLCRYCGESGHFAANCPKLARRGKPKPSRLNESTLAESTENAVPSS